jgi:hypothetical protein
VTPRLLSRLSLVAAAAALLVQVWPHARNIRNDEYPHGGAWEPRVKAIVDVSRVSARGGPYLSVPLGSGFQPADLKVNDLGFSAFGYLWGRWLGRPLDRRVLMGVNLAILVAALGALLMAAPPPARLLTSGVLLVTPVPVPEYRGPDPLASHASLAVLGIVFAAAVLRRWPLWCYPLLGVALLLMHKVRSAYALYAGAAIVALALYGAWRARGREPLLRAAALLLVCVPLELLWRLPLAARARDPRVAQQDGLGTHPIYIALLEGIGWSENKWGLKPSDPWVASYLGERFQAEPVDVGTVESERRSRIVYFELLRSDPWHLGSVYVSRLPAAARDHVFGGGLGALALAVALPAALALARSRPAPEAGLLLAAAGLSACVLFQTVVLDPRLLYAYPLRVTTGLTLAFAAAFLIERAATWPPGTPPRNP